MTQTPPPDERPHVNHVLHDVDNTTPQELAALFNEHGMRGALAETMGIELLEVAADRTVGRMPVAGNTQPYGILHGGATVVLAETVGSIAAATGAGPTQLSMGIEVSATHHRSPKGAYVTATATPRHVGRTLATYIIDVVDEDGRRTATCILTVAIRPLEQR